LFEALDKFASDLKMHNNIADFFMSLLPLALTQTDRRLKPIWENMMHSGEISPGDYLSCFVHKDNRQRNGFYGLITLPDEDGNVTRIPKDTFPAAIDKAVDIVGSMSRPKYNGPSLCGGTVRFPDDDSFRSYSFFNLLNGVDRIPYAQDEKEKVIHPEYDRLAENSPGWCKDLMKRIIANGYAASLDIIYDKPRA